MSLEKIINEGLNSTNPQIAEMYKKCKDVIVNGKTQNHLCMGCGETAYNIFHYIKKSYAVCDKKECLTEANRLGNIP